jgi:hypothetical protein
MMLFSEILSESTSQCSKLCFLGSELKQHVSKNSVSLSQEEPSGDLVQLILASLTVTNSSLIHTQDSLVNTFLSTLVVEDSSITAISITNYSFEIVSSTFVFSRMSLSNITTTHGEFILVSLDSNFTIQDIKYESSNSILFNVRSSKLAAKNIEYLNVTGMRYLFEIYDSNQAEITNITARKTLSTSNSIVSIKNSLSVSIEDVTISDIEQVVFEIVNSNVTKIERISVTNSQKVMYIKNSNINSIQSSDFTGNGRETNAKGGAMEIQDSYVVIQNGVFQNNTAEVGAAIYFDCTSLTLCNLFITNSTFEKNAATSKGGGIYYGFKRPQLANNTFKDNSAPYGLDLGSYAVKINVYGRTDEIVINNVASGKVIEPFALALLDYDNQIMVLNDVNQISIVPVDQVTIEGTNSILMDQGVAYFDNLIAIAIPGSSSVRIKATSKAIDSSKIQNIYGTSISENILYLNFRNCTPGEYVVNNLR